MNSVPLLPKKLVRSLFATTSLTAITAVGAHAGTITESFDFGDTFNTATALPGGTTQVLGTLTPSLEGGDHLDWFEFRSLAAGGLFSLSATGTESGLRINLYDSTDTLIPYTNVSHSSGGNPTLEGGGTIITGIIPSDGNLFADVFTLYRNGPTRGYEVDLTAAQATVPEPGTSTTLGLGLAVAAGLAWRKRRTAAPSV